MQVFRKILALTLALTLTLSMGAVSVLAAESNPADKAAAEAAIELVKKADFTLTQSAILKIIEDNKKFEGEEISPEDAATGLVANIVRQAIGDTAKEKKFSMGVYNVGDTYKPAVEGTASNPNGTNGSYDVRITLWKKNGLRNDSATATITGCKITPINYNGGGNALPELGSLFYYIDEGLPTESEGSPEIPITKGVYKYTVSLPLGVSFSTIGLLDYSDDDERLGYTRESESDTIATPQNPVATMKIVSTKDPRLSTTYTVSFVTGGGSNDNNTGGGKENPSSNNTANTPETVEKVKDTVNALKDPEKALPADVAKTTTVGGKEISTIPVALTSGSASVGMDLFNTLGDSSSSVGLKFTVKSGLVGGSMEVVIPGGFGKITEPGRIGYSMDFADKAENNDNMLKAVKGENVTSTTAKIGGNQTLPVTATITVATKVANGTTVNIYKYDPHTKKFVVIGKAIAKDGKLTFGTKIMGEMLFTTGTI